MSKDTVIMDMEDQVRLLEEAALHRTIEMENAISKRDKLISKLHESLTRYESALSLIAVPRRPDGTWNRDREACHQIATKALK